MLLALLLLAGGGQDAMSQQRLALDTESRLWIDGSSTLHDFTCEAEELEGYGMLEDSRPKATHTSNSDESPSARAEVIVRVEVFDCGKKKMNRDFYKALKAEVYPVIRYELERVEVLSLPTDETDHYQLLTAGRIILAGVERRIDMAVVGQRMDDGRYRVQGRRLLQMSDFGIEPPTALLGLIRAHDRILVRFDLVASSTPAKSSTTQSIYTGSDANLDAIPR